MVDSCKPEEERITTVVGMCVMVCEYFVINKCSFPKKICTIHNFIKNYFPINI